MSGTVVFLAVILLMVMGFLLGRARAFSVAGDKTSRLHSLPGYHGYLVALWCGVPSLLLLIVWSILEPMIADRAMISAIPADVIASRSADEFNLFLSEIRRLAAQLPVTGDVPAVNLAAAKAYNSAAYISSLAMTGVVLALAVAGLAWGRSLIQVELRARNEVERAVRVIMILASTIAILTTIGIVLSLIFETLRFFSKVPFTEFVFGLQWSPQTALRADQVGSSGAFGAIPLIAGTMLITVIAMAVAVPIGLLSAIYMSEYAGPKLRSFAKPVLEVLAGIPTVVYGFFAALTVAPFFRGLGDFLDVIFFEPLFGVELGVSSESALAAGIVMGIMIIPFVSSLSDDVMNAVPQTLRDGSYALGATQAETVRQVIFPAALPGIVGAVLLAVSRAIGETMIVVMAAGLAANLTVNPLEAVTTITVQIVTLLVGDQEFDSAKTLAAFALGFMLFVVTLVLNFFALHIVRKYREKYD